MTIILRCRSARLRGQPRRVPIHVVTATLFLSPTARELHKLSLDLQYSRLSEASEREGRGEEVIQTNSS